MNSSMFKDKTWFQTNRGSPISAVKVTKAEKKQTTPLWSLWDGYSPELLDLTKDNLADKFVDGVSMIASLSFTLSYPTLAAALHMFVDAYKNVLAVAVISVVSIENATVLASKKKKGKKDEPVGESDDDLGFSLFD
ncbi:60S acidic ribosomal protein P0-like [Asparagus officinalis]|uniref:60S acidic ribosomal protein P0-like n=1 Tax=Asparagus officinalis TaxID=4686 RepID=UPI00098E2DB9|nr:60S acidic ribosomal protein P0-like [Asparagus officinalis]